MVSKNKQWKRGYEIMAEFFRALLSGTSSPFSIAPTTDYQKHVPQSAQQLAEDNWQQTGDSLRHAIKKVGKDIGEE